MSIIIDKDKRSGALKGIIMKGKTHAGVGVTALICVADKMPGKLNYLGLVLVLAGSLLADIDHPKSIINKYILPFKNKATKVTIYTCIGLLVLWYDYLHAGYSILKAVAAAFLIIAISTHRSGLTHSVAGMIMFSFIVGYIGNSYKMQYLVYYFMLGYGMHLVCDMMTNRGIPILYPFIEKRVKFPFAYKSNSKIGNMAEQFIMIVGLVLAIYKFSMMFN